MKKQETVAPQEIWEALLRDVYHPVTACVCVDADGRVLSLRLFDTAFYRKTPCVDPMTHELWLICSHPDGCMLAQPEEIRCAKRLREQAGGIPVRTWLAGEDTGCHETTF